jgi:hypothetical protein
MDSSTTISSIEIGVIMNQVFPSREQHIFVLQMEVEILKNYYYKPDGQATGHYNTAIGVLEERIKDLHAQKEPDWQI